MEKICPRCKVSKPVALFSFDRQKADGLCAICRECKAANRKLTRAQDSIRDAKWREDNREWVSARFWSYRNENIERISAVAKTWRDNNREKSREDSKIWRLLNPDAFKINHNTASAKRRAVKLRAIPPWVNEIELKLIREMYAEARRLTKETGVLYHVDHLVPLNSLWVQGFHCLSNLEITTQVENDIKGNRWWPYMFTEILVPGVKPDTRDYLCRC